MLEKLTATSDKLAGLHAQFAKRIISEVDAPLGKFKTQQRAIKKVHETEMDKATKAVAKEEHVVDKCRKDYEAKCNAMRQAVATAAKG